MNKNVSAFLVTTSLLAAGCTAPAEKIKIRPVGDAAAQSRPFNEQIAYGRAQLELGNVGLALEAFRKAIREQPDNPDALGGIADSYATMGKHDLARRYYEAALAVAPHDPALLQAVATQSTRPADNYPAVNRAVQDMLSAPPPAPAATVTIKLPAPVTSADERTASVAPRLERLSTGEVALVTTAKPLWQTVVVSRTRLSTTVRWVPIRSAATQPPIRLLNAARHQGLAARTRQSLSAQGWRKLAIGDAPKVRSTSIVLYPGRHEKFALSLASRLGVHAVSMARGDAIVVLLGRDSVQTRSRSLHI